MSGVAFWLYLAFMASWFLHLAERYTFLGAIRADLIMVCAIITLTVISAASGKRGAAGDRTTKVLWVLVVYLAITIPLVEWPGSVMKSGFLEFFKAFVFSYFTATLVTTPKRLKYLLFVFVACQTFRVLEPVYLHVAEGYWGSSASMADWQSMDRLAGAPSDVLNPNGLAFVALTVIPFLHYLTSGSLRGRLFYAATLPVLLYALILTGSRSGLIGLSAIGALVWWKSHHKAALATVFILAVVGTGPYLSADLSDRYRSIFSDNTKNAATTQYRVYGVQEDFKVAMRRPLFGHGLGTSREANANFGVHDQPSHNIYIEAAQEIGLIGLLIFILFIGSLVFGLRRAAGAVERFEAAPPVLRGLIPALQVWIGMDILFSFASYGLSSYEWYLAAGLVSVVERLLHPAEALERAAATARVDAVTSLTPLASRL